MEEALCQLPINKLIHHSYYRIITTIPNRHHKHHFVTTNARLSTSFHHRSPSFHLATFGPFKPCSFALTHHNTQALEPFESTYLLLHNTLPYTPRYTNSFSTLHHIRTTCYHHLPKHLHTSPPCPSRTITPHHHTQHTPLNLTTHHHISPPEQPYIITPHHTPLHLTTIPPHTVTLHHQTHHTPSHLTTHHAHPTHPPIDQLVHYYKHQHQNAYQVTGAVSAHRPPL